VVGGQKQQKQLAPQPEKVVVNSISSTIPHPFPDHQMLGSLSKAGVKDPQLQLVLDALNTTTTAPKGGVFPSTAIPPEALSDLMTRVTSILERYVSLPEWLSKTVG